MSSSRLGADLRASGPTVGPRPRLRLLRRDRSRRDKWHVLLEIIFVPHFILHISVNLHMNHATQILTIMTTATWLSPNCLYPLAPQGLLLPGRLCWRPCSCLCANAIHGHRIMRTKKFCAKRCTCWKVRKSKVQWTWWCWTADQNSWPLLTVTVSLCFPCPRRRQLWQIPGRQTCNGGIIRHRSSVLVIYTCSKSKKTICFQTRLSQGRKIPIQVQFVGGHTFRKCFHLQFLTGIFIWVRCIIV